MNTEMDGKSEAPEVDDVSEVNEEAIEAVKPVDEDPYAYLNRDFSSENFKIEIKNLPKYYGICEFRKLLNNTLKLNSNKIKTTKRNSPYAFVCFRNEEDREKAIKVLTDFKWKGKQLQAIYAKPSADPLVKKRKEEFDDNNASKRQKNDNLPVNERIKLSTVPLVDVEYEKQLQMKQEEVTSILRKLADDLASENLEIQNYIEKQQEKYNGLPCELMDIRFSNQVNGYRNKCEFTIGINPENQLPTVGFRISAYVNGTTAIGPVEHLDHIPDSMKLAVKLFQDFVRSSDLEVFNAEFQSGHLKQFSVRTAPEQLMVIVGIHPQNLPIQKIEEFKEKLIEFFSQGPGQEAKVTSLYYEEIVKKGRGESRVPATFLWGETHIFETIKGLKFRISPEAFFQVNTKAAEVLYQSVIELAQPTDNSTMIDVCCGTGTIGLCFAKHCGQILGLEIVPQAIVDAKENATLNNITNSAFFTGEAEKILGSVCYNSKFDDVFAVVDPPRAGLHLKGVHQLRKIKKINRLVYISCNPKLASKNFVDLGRRESKYLQGECFVPVKAVAVDLFPHTNHCELVILFKRWDLLQKDLTTVV